MLSAMPAKSFQQVRVPSSRDCRRDFWFWPALDLPMPKLRVSGTHHWLISLLQSTIDLSIFFIFSLTINSTERSTAGRWNARQSIVVIRSVLREIVVYAVRITIRAALLMMPWRVNRLLCLTNRLSDVTIKASIILTAPNGLPDWTDAPIANARYVTTFPLLKTHTLETMG